MAYLHEYPSAEGAEERLAALRSVFSENMETEPNVGLVDKERGPGGRHLGKSFKFNTEWTVEDVHGNMLDPSSEFAAQDDESFRKYTSEWEHSKKVQRNLVERGERPILALERRGCSLP